MARFQQHYFVCVNNRPPFAKPSCGPRDGHPILARLQEEVENRGFGDRIKVTGCACLGPCEDGPIVVVYPEDVWYAGIALEDIQEIVESHMLQGHPVERLRYTWPEQT